MGKQYCPSCGSHDVELEDEGGMVCLDCGRHADIFPEEHMLLEGEDDEDEAPKKKPTRIEEGNEDIEFEDKPTRPAKSGKGKRSIAKSKKAKKATKKRKKK